MSPADNPEEHPGLPIEPISTEEALRRLREFMRQLEKLLADLAENPGRAVPGRHHEAMHAAWVAVKPKFNDSIRALKEISEEGNIIVKLQQSGLTGDELVFKLSIFRHAHDELLDHGPTKDVEPGNLPWWNRFRDLLTSTLKAADVILGSLAGVFPVVVEPIKEYKEAVESSVELGQTVAKGT
jgi:hypothetical protein